MQIKIFTVGGTIDKVYFDELSEYRVGDPTVSEILDEMRVAFDYSVEALMRKDSLDMTGEDREQIRRRVAADPHRLILITHGTDTMTHTAAVLKTIGAKVIVLTGAIMPAGFRSSDAAFNIGTAVGALQILQDGVYIAMNGRIFHPENIRKNRKTNRFDLIDPE